MILKSHHHHGEIVDDINDYNIWNKKEKKNNIYEFILNILFRLYSMISFLQGSNNFKEVTTITERLLMTSLTTILKRIFEIRKEK